MAMVLNGKKIAKEIRAEIKEDAAKLSEKLGRKPGLAVLLVGEDEASKIYVRNKERAAAKAGLLGRVERLAADATQAEVLAAVDALNADPEIDAFLVQLPLPDHLDSDEILMRIDPEKDGDGLHPLNLGRMTAGMPSPLPCTPAGILELLDRAEVPIEGKRAVVVGRSTIVGKPIALLLLARHATVTLCHSRTQNLAEEVGRADIVIAAVGRAELIRGEWIKVGAAVIDVGVNRGADGLLGDVEFKGASERAAVITPVPGGVGPLTIAMLLKNTLKLAAAKL
ncbi:bifunctional methylenetetrahydrofolate dehydrogenase/methenyltetrahydrofolate cyclohydrolase FolD [Myxococcota bacterium]|nr:bifunctional methylenetetrahydrofolate dehydrogenase/methenyltetrahydrofolate cyclohydrolase FolD [Myxococcota bacterium]